MNLILRGSIIGLLAAGLVACGGGTENDESADTTTGEGAGDQTTGAEGATTETPSVEVPAENVPADTTPGETTGTDEDPGSASAPAVDSAGMASFAGTWTIDQAAAEAQMDAMIQEQLANASEQERAQMQAMIPMMKQMGMQMFTSMKFEMNEDGTVAATIPGGMPGQMQEVVGQWTYADGAMRVGLPDPSLPDAEIEWVDVTIVDNNTITLKPPADEPGGPQMELKLVKSEG